MTLDIQEEFDVVIIGAGINGAGLFRELCAQGLRCLIVDKSDYGSGTSAAPSRLIHGGLKYLETGEFRLVAESTYERNLLLRNAPHLVKPLATVIPIYSWIRGIVPATKTLFGSTTAPRSRGAVLIKIGLRLYDFYGSKANVMPRHRLLSRRKALTELPALTSKIVAAGTYYDAFISAPERLVLELIKDGLEFSPTSRAVNWSTVEKATPDTLSVTTSHGHSFSVGPKFVVNACGPWIDGANRALGIQGKLIGGTKGSHIVIDNAELMTQLDGRMVYFESDDGRILLVFPYNGKALVGSTDIPADDPDEVYCTDEEIEYFLRGLNELFPALTFDRDQIVYAYAGIRPLPNSEGVAPGLISRDHSAPVEPPTQDRTFPVMSLVGGKWTTFRGFSESVADTILGSLKARRLKSTDTLPIGGGTGMPTDESSRTEWIRKASELTKNTGTRLNVLLDRYGTTAVEIAEKEGAAPTFLKHLPDYSAEELGWIAAEEHVVHLQDILLRRTNIAITGQLNLEACREVQRILSEKLGWTSERSDAELQDLLDFLGRYHAVDLH